MPICINLAEYDKEKLKQRTGKYFDELKSATFDPYYWAHAEIIPHEDAWELICNQVL